ncbi:MAG: hypothetical protein C7B46_15595, partial [Sulfobacillus benefaciens]
LRGTDLRQLYSQRVCQKPPSHSLITDESMVTFVQDVRRTIDVRIQCAPVFRAVQSTFDSFTTKFNVLVIAVPDRDWITVNTNII